MQIAFSPVAFVRGGRFEIKDDNWAEVRSIIELDSKFSSETLTGLQDFSHLLIVYYFHRVDPSKIETAARHPRNNLNWPKVGIFAQRGKNRPNQIGVSTCRLLKVEGSTIFVEGLDAVDGTPVLDIKPFLREFEPSKDTFQPDWATEIMRDYWKTEQDAAANP